MSAHTHKGSAGRNQKIACLRKYALLMVAIMLLSSLTMFFVSGDSSAAERFNSEHSITYHKNDGTNTTTTISYDGIAASEYNPLYWDNGAWGAPNKITVTYNNLNNKMNWHDGIDPISVNNKNHTVSIEPVFAGWAEHADKSGRYYYPGDVVPSTVSNLYAIWVAPDIYKDGSDAYRFKTDSLNSHRGWPTYYTYDPSDTGFVHCTAFDASKQYWSNMYLQVHVIKSNTNTARLTSDLPAGTYRSENFSSPQKLNVYNNTGISCLGDVMMDHVNIYANTSYIRETGIYSIYANYHHLIMGTGITADLTKASSGSDYSNAVSLVGGSKSNDATAALVRNYGVVSADNGCGGYNVNLATHVLVHSGTYCNIVGGSIKKIIGSDTNPLSTCVVVKNALVLDTILGGNGGSYGNQNKPIYGSTENNKVNTGGTFVYLIGTQMPGDYYEDVNYFTYSGRDTIKLEESSMVNGGSLAEVIRGTSHVFVSGNSNIWDAVGAGRTQNSVVDTSYLELSGSALVRHASIGGICDGQNGGTATPAIKHSNITVMHNAASGMVVGANFDVWTTPGKYSMYGSDATISVKLKENCTVGYVYGGGYRGTIGMKVLNGVDTIDALNSVSIEMTGGTVLNDLYGGGAGGVDKSYHNSSGVARDASINRTTGKSEVYANSILVKITGGIIKGSVYGGGQSCPVLSNDGGQLSTSVAAVYGNTLEVSLSTGTVGSVYGGGKGIYNPSNATQYIRILTRSSDSQNPFILNNLNWNTSSYSLKEKVDYLNFAKVVLSGTNPKFNINVGAGATVENNVYGGGSYGLVTGSPSITVRGVVQGNVYGGGSGSSGNSGVGSITGSTSVNIENSVQGNVFGGGAFGQVSGTASLSFGILAKIGDAENPGNPNNGKSPDQGGIGNVYGGGQGSSTQGTGQVGSV
ncbi:MAG: hypothetical protein MJZ38_05705, partial [archaeon]|nr:hypothetical protein [archaeon]